MSAERNTSLYFATVTALPRRRVYVGGHLSIEGTEPTGTIVLEFNEGKWRLIDKSPDVINSLASRRDGTGIALLGREGYFVDITTDHVRFDRRIDVVRKDFTYLEALIQINGHYYCCGGLRQVFELSGGAWQDISKDIYVDFDGPPETFLVSIDGTTKNLVFTCGSDGFVARWDGIRWINLDAPTNVFLNRIYCIEGEQVLVCGGGGILMRANREGIWTDLTDKDVCAEKIWDMTMYKGQLYLAAGNKLLVWDERDYRLVSLPVEEPFEITALAANESLWCVGDETLYEFDGREWRFHICPANR